jgi:hypothetical protein
MHGGCAHDAPPDPSSPRVAGSRHNRDTPEGGRETRIKPEHMIGRTCLRNAYCTPEITRGAGDGAGFASGSSSGPRPTTPDESMPRRHASIILSCSPSCRADVLDLPVPLGPVPRDWHRREVPACAVVPAGQAGAACQAPCWTSRRVKPASSAAVIAAWRTAPSSWWASPDQQVRPWRLRGGRHGHPEATAVGRGHTPRCCRRPTGTRCRPPRIQWRGWWAVHDASGSRGRSSHSGAAARTRPVGADQSRDLERSAANRTGHRPR